MIRWLLSTGGSSDANEVTIGARCRGCRAFQTASPRPRLGTLPGADQIWSLSSPTKSVSTPRRSAGLGGCPARSFRPVDRRGAGVVAPPRST